MKKTLVFLIPALISCGQDYFQTAHGVTVVDSTDDGSARNYRQDIEIINSLMNKEVQGGYKALKNLTLEITDETLYLDGEVKQGLFHPDERLIQVRHERECFANSAYAHELGHLYQYTRDKQVDYAHVSKKWWGGINPANGLIFPGTVHRVKFNAQRALCKGSMQK